MNEVKCKIYGKGNIHFYISNSIYGIDYDAISNTIIRIDITNFDYILLSWFDSEEERLKSKFIESINVLRVGPNIIIHCYDYDESGSATIKICSCEFWRE